MDLQQQNIDQRHPQQQAHLYATHPISPPISAGGVESKSDSPAASLVMMASGQRVPQQQQSISNGVSMVDPSAWNPSRIFE
jgi:hypothetical protein